MRDTKINKLNMLMVIEGGAAGVVIILILMAWFYIAY